MFYTIADLLEFNARTGEDRFPVTEIFFDETTGRVRYVALDIGGWLDTTQVLVSTSRFEEPDPDNREWAVELRKSEIETLPTWKDEGWFDWFASFIRQPPVVVGPAGSGYDPLMLARMNQVASEETEEAKHHAELSKIEAEKRVSGLSLATEIIGMAAQGRDGRLGGVADLLYDPRDRQISHFIVDNQELLSDGLYAILYRMSEQVDKDQGHVRFGLSKENLEKAQQAKDMHTIRRSPNPVTHGYYTPGF